MTEVNGKLTWEDIAWIHFKVVLTGIWLSFVLSTPSDFLKEYSTTMFFWLWMISAIGGTIVSVIGLVMSAGTARFRRLGFRVEAVGLFGSLAGPLCYAAISFGEVFTGEATQGRLTIGAMAYALSAALIARILMVFAAAKKREYQAEVTA